MKNEISVQLWFLFRDLVGVKHFAGERIVFQGAWGAGAAVVQHLPTVLHLLLILSLQICRSLKQKGSHVVRTIQIYHTSQLCCFLIRRTCSVWTLELFRVLRRGKGRGYWGCSSARSPAPPSLGSSRSSAMFPQRLPPASAGPGGPRLSLSPSVSKINK